MGNVIRLLKYLIGIISGTTDQTNFHEMWRYSRVHKWRPTVEFLKMQLLECFILTR